MSLRYEQYRSLERTRDFLRELLPPGADRRAKTLREKAYRCLRHFPPLMEGGAPMFSMDDFGPDIPPAKVSPEGAAEIMEHCSRKDPEAWDKFLDGVLNEWLAGRRIGILLAKLGYHADDIPAEAKRIVRQLLTGAKAEEG